MNNENTSKKVSLVNKIAEKFSVDPSRFYDTLKATAFKQHDGSAPTNEQMMALMIVADQYGLNPFTKEIYAFPDKKGGIVPVVGADGWIRIINDHNQLDGIEFVASDVTVTYDRAKPCPEWIDCIIYRKDRAHPIKVREYLDETYRQAKYASPWQTHTKRMLRHKALIQASRIAFGFSGIYDQDEAERIIEKEVSGVDTTVKSNFSSANLVSSPEKQEQVTFDNTKMNVLLDKLSVRAEQSSAWAAAQEYVQDRYKGQELEYAINYLREKEIDAMPIPKDLVEEDVVISEQEPMAPDENLTNTISYFN